jgi:hypothetical protein
VNVARKVRRYREPASSAVTLRPQAVSTAERAKRLAAVQRCRKLASDDVTVFASIVSRHANVGDKLRRYRGLVFFPLQGLASFALLA